MKPNTYTKLYVHCVFTPKGRKSLLTETKKTQTLKYIHGIIQGLNCFPVIINGMEDHVHALIGFPPTLAISDMMRDIKRSSALYINNEKLFPNHFSWQDGFGAFTVGYRELDKVFQYIKHQEEHHSNVEFRKEYINLLTEEGVDFENEYLFEFYE